MTNSNTSPKATINFIGSHITILVLLGLLVIFVGSATFFALHLKRGIIPDEPAHFTLSKQFSTTFGIPPDVPETYALGYIGHKPFLYYWLNGRFLNVLELLIPGVSSWKMLVALRLLSTIYSAMTVVFCYLLSMEIFENRWWQILTTFLLINTLMFVFLSGGVNYDNLVNLCACAGIYFLVRVIRGKSFYENSLAWLIFISAGTLTEGKTLPLAFITSAVWLVYVVRNHQQIDLPPRWTWKLTGLTVIFIALLSLNLSIWGVNLVKYHALTPPCNKIMTQDQCNFSPFIARAQRLNLPEKLTLSDVVKEEYPDPVKYIWDYWTLTMPARDLWDHGAEKLFSRPDYHLLSSPADLGSVRCDQILAEAAL